MSGYRMLATVSKRIGHCAVAFRRCRLLPSASHMESRGRILFGCWVHSMSAADLRWDGCTEPCHDSLMSPSQWASHHPFSRSTRHDPVIIAGCGANISPEPVRRRMQVGGTKRQKAGNPPRANTADSDRILLLHTGFKADRRNCQ